MSDPEAPEPDAVSIDAEVPEGDALEQAESVVGGAAPARTGDRSLDADEADVQDQRREESVEDDDYSR